MNWKIIVAVFALFAVLIALRFFVYGEFGGKAGFLKSAISSSDTALVEGLVLTPQEARDSVKVDSVTMSQDGFVVIRGSDGTRLGQVIEISRFLEVGMHENVTIELGDFYIYTEADQLIVMIYHDDGDKAFSELDQPASNTPAIFVETGQPVPLSVLEQQVAAHNGTGMETVRYTNAGFQPAKLTVPSGTMVEFLNQSDKEMWVASNVHPGHELLPTFDQFNSVGKGKNYMYVFDTKGIWPYHDHINPAVEGIITVE